MKQGAKLTRGIILMMLLALIAYGIAAAFSALEKSTATVTAIAYEVGDGFQSTGFVAPCLPPTTMSWRTSSSRCPP